MYDMLGWYLTVRFPSMHAATTGHTQTADVTNVDACLRSSLCPH